MNYEKLDALIEERREEFLSDLGRWLAIPSVRGEAEEGAPFGRENPPYARPGVGRRAPLWL